MLLYCIVYVYTCPVHKSQYLPKPHHRNKQTELNCKINMYQDENNPEGSLLHMFSQVLDRIGRTSQASQCTNTCTFVKLGNWCMLFSLYTLYGGSQRTTKDVPNRKLQQRPALVQTRTHTTYRNACRYCTHTRILLTQYSM